MDYNGQLSNVNPGAQELLNIKDDWKGKNLQEYNSPLVEEIARIEEGQSRMISINGMDKYKCQINEVIHQGFKRKFILIDNLSIEILQSEKEAFGRIIRMMAHEVNNSMGAINSILDTVIEYGFKDGDNELKESLTIAKERNDSMSKFMANYASILRLPIAQKQRIDVGRLLKKSGQLFQPIANSMDIDISFDIPTHAVSISADPILLEQAFSNIIKNAMESIETDGDIKLQCLEHPVRVIISDNGAGIDPEAATHIFTPFFSTKPTGQGVGLMLVREILQQHDAQFSLATDPETNTTNFKINFKN